MSETLELPAFEDVEDGTEPCLCQAEVDVEVDYEPADPNYGADADGNRGMYVGPSIGPADDPPNECPTCGYKLTDEDKKAVTRKWQKDLEELVRGRYEDADSGYDYWED